MNKNGMRPIHPGEILREEIEALELSAKAFAEALDVPANRVTVILNGQRGITADTVLRLARYLGTTPELWLNLQKTYELRVAEIEAGKEMRPARGSHTTIRHVIHEGSRNTRAARRTLRRDC